MTDNDLCYISAVEAITAFKSKKLSPVELMQAVIARAEAVNPTINAFAHRSFDRALKQAKAAEAGTSKAKPVRSRGSPCVSRTRPPSKASAPRKDR